VDGRHQRALVLGRVVAKVDGAGAEAAAVVCGLGHGNVSVKGLVWPNCLPMAGQFFAHFGQLPFFGNNYRIEDH
jgi:hypothetical protein